MRGLENLIKYRYASIDKSLLNNMLQSYYRAFLYFTPKWMAPNLVTLIGLIFMTTAFMLATVYNLILQQPFPSWACVTCAILVWLYSTMDNVDGKQARRTGTSSPLGELFDHGCDAIATFVAAMGSKNSPDSLLLFLLGYATFFLSTAEHYHTKTLFLWYISGPTEGLLAACLVMLAAGYWGTEIWTQKRLGDFALIAASIPIPFVLQLSLVRTITCFCIGLLFACVVPWGFYNSLRSPNRKVSIPVMLLQGVPFFVFILILWQWPYLEGSGIYAAGRTNFFWFTMSASLVFARWMPTVVLCNFLHQPFPTYVPGLVPFFVGYPLVKFVPSVAAYYNPTTELVIFAGFTMILTVNYFCWAHFVIGTLCKRLKIKCFSIANPAQKKE